MRSSIIVVLAVTVLGCAPEFENKDVQDSLFAESLPPRAPSTSVDTQRAQGSNRARALWTSRDIARQRAWHVKSVEARQGLAFLRIAGEIAGSAVRTGVLTEASDRRWSFKPGSEELRVIRASGDAFSVHVVSLEGDVLAAKFPRANESLKTEVTLADGRVWTSELRGEVDEKDVEQVRTICSGVFNVPAVETQFAAEIDVTDRRSFETFTAPYVTRFAIEISTNALVEGVRVSGTESYVNCSNSVRCPSFTEHHELSSDVDGVLLAYERTDTTVEANTPAKVEWSGVISRDGREVGSLDKRALTSNSVSLEITFEGERYGIETVFGN